ncbi:MAG: hypothetical protein ACTSUF_03640 [Candidatus Heimdallarchaeaceae archaeon]
MAQQVNIKAENETIENDLGNIPVIEEEHHQIHEGKHFFISDYDSDVDIASPKYWYIAIPDTNVRVHGTFLLKSSKNGTIEVFINPTITNIGTELRSINNNPDSSVIAKGKCYKDPTVTNDGTRIYVEVMGTDGANPIGDVGGISERKRELIMTPDKNYIIKFTPENNDTRVSILIEWYELTI